MKFSSADTPIEALSDWLMEQALLEPELEELYEGCNRRLHAAGIPVIRAMLSSSILHPLYESFTVLWTLEGGIETTYHMHDTKNRDAWLSSPFHYMLEHDLPAFRRKLTGENAVLDFEVLEELAQEDMTDYLGYTVSFYNPSSEMEFEGPGPGIVGSWCTRRESGFTDSDLRALSRLQQRLAVAVKMCVKNKIAGNILDTYLGYDAGRKVLSGQIKRGSGEQIYSVIWYSDLQGSTELAGSMDGDAYIELLNRYFECTASEVLEHGGEVLRFPGDAVLGIFPISKHDTCEAACIGALKSSIAAFDRLAELNGERLARGDTLLNFGIGLHVGEVLFGNIGIPERLEFTVIGPAMNETARIEALTRKLNANILVSEKFIEHLERSTCKVRGEYRSQGEHTLRGVNQAMRVYEYFPESRQAES